ncbi:MAG: J domain-containing protein [Chloroflexaceae bacterium]|nr:J domain-containing protein [Chloroflexaceae bacterium]
MKSTYNNPYTVLDIPQSATLAEIKQAYFAQVKAHPPERDPAMFKRIRAAYESLRDPEKRIETDMLLLNEWSAPSRKQRQADFDLTLHTEDVLTVARVMSDLCRTDWREQYQKVTL